MRTRRTGERSTQAPRSKASDAALAALRARQRGPKTPCYRKLSITKEGTMGETTRASEEQPRWVQIDSWGKSLRGRQGEMDVEIGDWLLAARDENVHRRIGHASLLEYAERRLGLDGHSIRERLRVAEVLVGLPALRETL